MIDVKIMAVASRQAYAEHIKEQIPIAKIVYDDRGYNGGGDAWYNASRIWLQDYNTDVTHRLVLQDDIEVCGDFMRYVKYCVEFKPKAVWSFMVGHKAEKTFKAYDDTPYLQVRGCKTSGQAIIIPIELCADMVRDTDNVFGLSYKHDDSRIGWWCLYNNIDLFTTNPQLVQHRQIKSVLNHNAVRYSRTFRDDVSDLNWLADNYHRTQVVYPYLWTKDIKAIDYCNEAKRRFKNADNKEKIIRT